MSPAKGGLAMKRERKLPFDPKAFLSKVNGGRAIADYQKDQNIYKQGDPADSVFYIRSGKVKKTVVSEQGKEAVVALLGTGNFFGEGCLTGQPLRLSTVSAVTECVEFWQGRSAGTNHCENQPRDTGGDDRHDAISREFFHEQISGIGSY
jgi:signal-transduction protein with cAMP-binding, CBS, and nucleotidyltransferase domain